MSNREDRYHTTSWDGRQVQRQQQSAAGGQAPRSQQSRSASGGQGGSKKKAEQECAKQALKKLANQEKNV